LFSISSVNSGRPWASAWVNPRSSANVNIQLLRVFPALNMNVGTSVHFLLTQYLFVHQAWCSSSDAWLVSLQARRDKTKAYTINYAQWRAKLQSRQSIPKVK